MKSIESTGKPRPPAIILGCLGAIVFLASCSSELPTGGSEDRTSANSARWASACVPAVGSTGTIVEISRSDLAMRESRGDYLTDLVVTKEVSPPADGAHFHRIGDALAEVRAGRLARGELRSAACRITITVAAGVFPGTAFETSDQSADHFPLMVDVPDITLRGALVMRLDASGRATGNGVGAFATTLFPVEAMPFLNGASTPIIIANGHPHGPAGNGLTLEGFVFQEEPAICASPGRVGTAPTATFSWPEESRES